VSVSSTPTTPDRHATVTLPSGREQRLVIRVGGPPLSDNAIPYGADAVLRIVDGDLHDAVALAEVIQDLLFLGEATQRQSAEARLDETVADVEAARSAGRTDW